MNSFSKVNIIYLKLAKKLNFQVYYIEINIQKSDNSKLDIFNIIIVSSLVKDKNKISQFFKKSFLLTNFNINIILEISFLTFSNIEVNFIN